MEKTTSPARSAMIFGLLFGAIMILELVISFVLHLNPAENKNYGIAINSLNYLLLPVSFILIGCNNFKKNLNSGFISLSQCLKVGVTICVIAGLTYGVFAAVFNVIFPEFVAEILRSTKQAMLKQNPQMTKEQTEMAISMTEKFMNPLIAIPFTAVMYAFIGLIYSLIVGLIVKKDPK